MNKKMSGERETMVARLCSSVMCEDKIVTEIVNETETEHEIEIETETETETETEHEIASANRNGFDVRVTLHDFEKGIEKERKLRKGTDEVSFVEMKELLVRMKISKRDDYERLSSSTVRMKMAMDIMIMRRTI